ncbi:MAG: PKD domain-containing protein [Patescibacteria group bacterium]
MFLKLFINKNFYLYSIFFVLFFLGISFLNSAYAAIGNATWPSGTINCDRHGFYRSEVCYFDLSIDPANKQLYFQRVYDLQIKGDGITSKQFFSSCFSPYTGYGSGNGPCIIREAQRDTKGNWDILESDASERIDPDYSSDINYLNVLLNVTDGDIKGNIDAEDRRMSDLGLTAPGTVQQNTDFQISWTSFESFKITLSYAGAGISCDLPSGSSVFERGSTTCRMSQPSGSAQIKVDFEGPWGNAGNQPLKDYRTADVTVTSNPTPIPTPTPTPGGGTPTPTPPEGTPTPTPPAGGDCSPKNQSVSVNQNVSINVASGFNPYSWSAPGGDPTSDNDPNFNTVYHSAGNYTAAVTHSGGTYQCFVSVSGAAPTPPPPEQCIPNGQACGGNASRCCSGYCPSIQGAPDLCQSQSQPPPPPLGTFQARGYVYRDLNTTSCCNGVRDPGEPVLSGEEVRLARGEETITKTTADANGFYRFTNLSAGNYRVSHTIPSGYVRTTDDSAAFSVGPDFVHDFGIYAPGPAGPSVSNVTVTEPNYCISGPAATVTWTYSGASPQSAYQVQIDDQGSFQTPEWDSGKVLNSGTSNSTPQGLLAFNTTYRARAKAWDQGNVASDWAVSSSWKTPNNAYPQVNFIFTPQNPAPNVQIQFTDQTVFYSGNPSNWSWAWLFGDGGSSTQQNPVKSYAGNGTYNVTLTATDNANQSCSITKPINIQIPNPIWKEVNPGG